MLSGSLFPIEFGEKLYNIFKKLVISSFASLAGINTILLCGIAVFAVRELIPKEYFSHSVPASVGLLLTNAIDSL